MTQLEGLISFVEILEAHAGHKCAVATLRDSDKPKLRELAAKLRSARDDIAHYQEEIAQLRAAANRQPTDARFQAAKAAMQGFLHMYDVDHLDDLEFGPVVGDSVRIADALIAALNKQPEASAGKSPALPAGGEQTGN